ncbi:MAG: aldose epimerase family protein [Rikenellaceae bacterium]
MADTKIYTLYAGGVEMEVTNFGARVMKLFVEDREGNPTDIVLGYNTIEEYVDNKGERFYGAPCGRYANRIADGKFTIEGVEYTLPINNGPNSLHGGLKGIDMVVWDVVKVTESRIDFKYVSPDGAEGYPGEVTINMCYELTPDSEFVIEYSATTTKATHLNLTHHSFFNLAGESSNHAVADHVLRINADKYVPISEVCIPLGMYEDVEGTPFDFRVAKPIGQDENTEGNVQLKMGAGYDHSFVLNGKEGAMKFAAEVYDPASGRKMEVYTDQPGMQFYGCNWLDGKTVSKDGEGAYIARGAYCFETQHHPDTPNQPAFPSTLLEPGEEYTHRCIYKFGTDNE